MLDARCAASHGTIDSSAAVVNAMGSSPSVRCVATSLPAVTRTGSSVGPDSQNVTSACAAVGGNSCTPSSSRNFT